MRWDRTARNTSDAAYVAALPLLQWCLEETRRRYDLLAEKKKTNVADLEDTTLIPRIVVVIDEFANLLEEKQSKSILTALLGPSPVSIDDLIRMAGTSPAIVRTVLLELELAGRNFQQLVTLQPGVVSQMGDETSAGQREFDLARELGMKTAVTTRKGLIHPRHASQLTALPRVSLNGDYQKPRYVKVLLSGAPFALFNAVQRTSNSASPVT